MPHHKPGATPKIIKNAGSQVALTQAIPAGRDANKKSTQVKTIKDGEVVSYIEVTCSCGNISRIRCHYQ